MMTDTALSIAVVSCESPCIAYRLSHGRRVTGRFSYAVPKGLRRAPGSLSLCASVPRRVHCEKDNYNFLDLSIARCKRIIRRDTSCQTALADFSVMQCVERISLRT